MKYISNSITQTHEIAKNLASELKGGEIILLNGTLGAGKTTFTKGLGLALGVQSNITSPTFTLLKSYDGKLKLNHFDLYRIENSEELEELGFEDFLFDNNAVSVIEWNKFENICSPIVVNISYNGESSRVIEILRDNQ